AIAGRDRSYYNRVVNPFEDATPFFFTMNTWSGIYKRAFLEAHDIRHNETPGASYQDSGFWFLSFSWARRLYFLDRPFYMYRQDNPGSSINDKRKVYCVCDEYDYIYAFLEEHPAFMKAYKFMLTYRRYYSYMFAFARIGAQFRYDFVMRFHEDFVRHRARGELDQTLFSRNEWANLWLLMEDPEAFLFKNEQSIRPKTPHEMERAINRVIGERDAARGALQSVESSVSFRIGRKITAPMRFGRDIAAVARENGVRGLIETLRDRRERAAAHREWLADERRAHASGPVRVLFVASDNTPTSGAFLSMHALIRELKEQFGVESHVILPHGGQGGFLLDDDGIGHNTIASQDWVVSMDEVRDGAYRRRVRAAKRQNRRAVRRIAEVIENGCYDLVHINTTYAYVGALAARRAKVPFVWHLREFLEEDQHRTMWDRARGNQLINRADRVIAISQSIRQKYAAAIDANRLTVIHNGIDTARFHMPDRRIFARDEVVFLLVGGFSEQKGHPEFVRACVRVAESGFDGFKIRFIGTGNDEVKEECMAYLEAHGLRERAELLGYRRNVEDYLEDTDIAFCCSRAEGFGRVTVEAMLSGALVIGANTAGTAELIRDGETGLLYEQGNSDDLAEKMLRALSDRAHAAKMADAGRDEMARTMTAQINARNIHAVYREVLANAGNEKAGRMTGADA
ncbi:MAG: glycosyltransferase family 4 protein, partial [Christensenellales bacterium]